MAKKEKAAKISINAWEDKIERQEPIVKEWNGLEITIRPLLSFEDMLRFVNRVTRLCFNDDTNEYMPELKEFAVQSNILEMYAGFRLPDGAGKRYEMLYQSRTLVDMIVGSINKAQFDDIMSAINEKLKYMAQSTLSDIKSEATKLIGAIDNLQNSFAEMFDGMDNEKLDSLVKAITGNRLDEGKLVNAYFNEKMKQDTEK